MTQNAALTYEKTLKRFIMSVLCLVTISTILGGIGYYEISPVNYFLGILIFMMIFCIAIVYIIPVSYTKRLIKFYYLFLFFSVFPMTIFYLSKGIGTALFWYFPIPLFLYTVYSNMKAIRWSLFCLGLLLLAFVVTYIIRNLYFDDSFVHLSYYHVFYADLINGSFSLIMVYVCLYYLHKFRELRKKQLLDSVTATGYADMEEVDNLLNNSVEEEYKYIQIYQKIEEYFDTKQPYLDPDFKMVQMAHELNINIAYLAKAIRIKRNMNFSNFVNEYRIEKVKELIQNDSQKYTLKHIYFSSGFKNQSSFNKAFKLKEGITPSEYYKQNRIEKEG